MEKVLTDEKIITDWESVTLSNNFVFFKVMQDEERLAELIRRILPDLKFEKLEVIAQKEIQAGFDIHGVRLDIYAVDENGRAITIEMQVLNRDLIPKRLRYYSSSADSMLLEKSHLYSKLPDSYVIIICCFDLFDAGLHRYTFTNKCDEVPGLELGDGVKYIVLNTKSTKDDVSEELRNFLDFVDGKVSEDDKYIADLDIEVKKARMNKEWRREYMTIEQINLENQEIGKESVIIDMLNRGNSPDNIVKMTGYSYDYVNGIKAQSLAVHESGDLSN